MSRLFLTAAPAAAGRPDPGPVLAFSWEALSSRPGGEARAWEEWLPAADAPALEAATSAIAHGWYSGGGADFSAFEGFSLGRAARWPLWVLSLQPDFKLLACLKAAAEASGADGIALGRSVPEPLRSAARDAAAALGLPLEDADDGGAPGDSRAWRLPVLAYDAPRRAALRALDVAGRVRGGATVLACWYHTLEPLLPALRREGLRPVLADAPPRAKLASLAAAGVGAWPEPHEPSRLETSALAGLRDGWRARRDSREFAALCSWKGASLAPRVAALVDRLVADDAPGLAWSARRLRERWRRDRPAAVLLPYDGPPFQQLLLQAAKLEGTPSAALLHGLPFEYRTRIEHADADAFVVWGPEQARLYAAAGPGPRLLEGGNPAFDRLAAPAGRRATGRLLVLTYPYNVSSSLSSTLDCERHAVACAGAARDAGWEVVVRPHPSESRAHYERLLGPGVKVEGGPLGAALASCDAVLGGFSTVLVEAVLSGIPVIPARFTREVYPPPFDRGPLAPVEDVAILRGRLEAARRDPAEIPRLRAQQAHLLDGFVGPRDGSAAARMASLIAALVHSPRR